MTARMLVFPAAVLWVLALTGAARAGTGADAEAALGSRIRVQIEDRPFDEAVRALCKAAGLEAVRVEPGRKPNPTSRGWRRQSIGGVRSGSSAGWKDADGERLYSVAMAKPLPLREVLRSICEMEARTPKVAGGELVIADAGAAAAEEPFNAKEFDTFAGRVRVPVQRDWRRAVRFILQTGAVGMVEDQEEGKPFDPGGRMRPPRPRRGRQR
jgi:hypothetical protein